MFARSRPLDPDTGAIDAPALNAINDALPSDAVVSEDYQMIDHQPTDETLPDSQPLAVAHLVPDVDGEQVPVAPRHAEARPSALVGKVSTIVEDDDSDDEDEGLSMSPSEVELQSEDAASMEQLFAGHGEIPADTYINTGQSLHNQQIGEVHYGTLLDLAVGVGQQQHGPGTLPKELPMASVDEEGDDMEPPALQWRRHAKKLPYCAGLAAIFAVLFCWCFPVHPVHKTNPARLDKTPAAEPAPTLCSTEMNPSTNKTGTPVEVSVFPTKDDAVVVTVNDLNPTENVSRVEIEAIRDLFGDLAMALQANMKDASTEGPLEETDEPSSTVTVVVGVESTGPAPSDASGPIRHVEVAACTIKVPAFSMRFDFLGLCFILVLIAPLAILVALKRKKSSHRLLRQMCSWQQNLRRNGRPCRTTVSLKEYSTIIGSYEKLTVGDLRRVLLEGFGYKAPSNATKLMLIGTLRYRYEAALLDMEEPAIRAILGANGSHVPHDLTKTDLIRLALRAGV